jgi:hypothetical protein
MNIYEIISWGAQEKEGDPDTIYLVRATDHLEAVEEVVTNASRSHHGGKRPFPHVIYHIGIDSTIPKHTEPRILRGPYFECAYNHGWKSWHRVLSGAKYTQEWEQLDFCPPKGDDSCAV